jgi:hypothetical protein
MNQTAWQISVYPWNIGLRSAGTSKTTQCKPVKAPYTHNAGLWKVGIIWKTAGLTWTFCLGYNIKETGGILSLISVQRPVIILYTQL